jgi:hypothetical protein
MDEKELDEGITWRELFQRLKEKAKVEAEAKEEATAWIDLLLMLFNERSFHSLRKDSGRKVVVVKEKSSEKVLEYFFEKAWERPILKSRFD